VDDGTLATLRALVDGRRLRIVGLLAIGPQTREQLAGTLRLAPSALARHLERLEAAGLLKRSSTPSGSTHFALRPERLAAIGRELHAMHVAGDPVAAEEVEVAGPDGQLRPAAEAKVLRSFFLDGRLQTIPAQDRKRQVVLRYLAETVFTEDREYPEKEVNQLLALRHPDVASLRRYLVDSGYVEREAGRYRLRPRAAWPAAEH
jgi:DNA-binding HxlR family transcriptional regulator